MQIFLTSLYWSFGEASAPAAWAPAAPWWADTRTLRRESCWLASLRRGELVQVLGNVFNAGLFVDELAEIHDALLSGPA